MANGADPVAGAAEAVERPDGGLARLDRQVRQAIVLGHRMDALQVTENFRNAVDCAALIELLIARGVIGITDLDERRRQVAETLAARRAKEWQGPTLYPLIEGAPVEPVRVGCESRHEHCGAACCSLYNVYLTAGEVRAGTLLWDLGEPYRLMRGEDGLCRYLDRRTFRCTTWEDRPYVCRQYTCAVDTNVWVDFEKRIPTDAAKELAARGGPKVQP